MRSRKFLSYFVPGVLFAAVAMWAAIVLFYLNSAPVSRLFENYVNRENVPFLIPINVLDVYLMHSDLRPFIGSHRAFREQESLMIPLAQSVSMAADNPTAAPVQNRVVALMDHLIQLGAPLDTRLPPGSVPPHGLTALQSAVLGGQVRVAKFLIDHGADVSAVSIRVSAITGRTMKQTLLGFALCGKRAHPQADYRSVIQLVLDSYHKADLNADMKQAREEAASCHSPRSAGYKP